jgi:hypothetical protein
MFSRKDAKSSTRNWKQCLQLAARLKKVPTALKNALIILLRKEGDAKTYRSTGLLSSTCKLFLKAVPKRICKILNDNQPREQPGFGNNFSTIDHLFAH